MVMILHDRRLHGQPLIQHQASPDQEQPWSCSNVSDKSSQSFLSAPACGAGGTVGCTCPFGGREGACPCPLPRLRAGQPSDETRLPRSLLEAPTCKVPSDVSQQLSHEPDRQEPHCFGHCTSDAGMHTAQTLSRAVHAAAPTRHGRAAGEAPGSPLHHDEGLDAPAFQAVPAGQAEQAPPAHGVRSAHAL